MYVPVPVLIGIGVALFLLLIGRVARATRGHDPLMGGTRGAPPPSLRSRESPLAIAAPSTTLPPEVEVQVRALVAAGRKIEAVKLAREATRLGLKEAKDMVESLE